MKRSLPPIIMLALPKHDDAYTSTPYQLAKEFAKQREVWYVSHPYTWLDFLKNIRQKKAWKRFFACWTSGIVGENVSEHQLKILYLPLVLPINSFTPGMLYDILSNVNHHWVAKTIRKLLRLQNIEEYIFINSHDFYLGRIIKKLPKTRLNVYHCIDPIVKAYSARHGHYLEKEAAQTSDLVVATAPFLQRKMKQYHRKSYCVPNAANFELSNQAARADTEIHPSIASINGVKIGYIGNIERRINYAWLTEIFSRQKDWQLIMVGPCSSQFIPDSFFQMPNVHYVLPIPHVNLPHVLKGFDVTLIPFVKDAVSAQIYPLKLFEYMGSGKPVVTTDFNPEVLEAFQQDIKIGRSADELETAIEQALSETEAGAKVRRIEVARQNDWEARAKHFSTIINEHTRDNSHQKNIPSEPQSEATTA